MKKYILIFILIIFIFNCIKFNKKNNTNQQNIIISDSSTDKTLNIDFNAMEKTLNESTKLDIDVFFAMAVLHKRYISQFADQVQNLSESEQQIFFQEKNKIFYESIKYSEDEYNKFMEKNTEAMTDYINNHKEIQEYLTTIN